MHLVKRVYHSRTAITIKLYEMFSFKTIIRSKYCRLILIFSFNRQFTSVSPQIGRVSDSTYLLMFLLRNR
jgi:hypothetical protein